VIADLAALSDYTERLVREAQALRADRLSRR